MASHLRVAAFTSDRSSTAFTVRYFSEKPTDCASKIFRCGPNFMILASRVALPGAYKRRNENRPHHSVVAGWRGGGKLGRRISLLLIIGK